jgi:hypothetical protein
MVHCSMSQDQHNEIEFVLERDRERLGSVNPQFSFYQRIAESAKEDASILERVHSHIKSTGSFDGL